ncbi:uncharacterized protein LOC118750938 [Rhagoletis pomonella]|uniref:uncharacterized protein LOC118750938 n=1 Tax=Rhagoletis pomonella TaxID=28610 RepID=UPI0017818DA0|nr:uncharacterized protein LOC118750938 [Rhagoletis pomonella]
MLAEQIDDSTFCTVNDDAPTRVAGDCYSSPDITIASGGLINCIGWQPVLTLASDHLPIVVAIDQPRDFMTSENRTFMNTRKANWDGFTEFTDRKFNALPLPSCARVAERNIRRIINAAAARFIPAGRIAKIRPGFPTEAAGLADERDGIRQANPGDPRIRDLNRDIRNLVNEHKRNKWNEHLKSCNLSSGASKLWSTVKSLSNPTKRRDNVALTFGTTTTSDPRSCARFFSRQFIAHPERDKTRRSVLRKAHKLRPRDTPLCFTTEETQAAVNHAKSSKALGPDGISMQMLKS